MSFPLLTLQCSNTRCSRRFSCRDSDQGDISGIICPRCYVATPAYHVAPKKMAAAFYDISVRRFEQIYACVLCESAGRANHRSYRAHECLDCTLRLVAFREGTWRSIGERKAKEVIRIHDESLGGVMHRLQLISAGEANVDFSLTE